MGRPPGGGTVVTGYKTAEGKPVEGTGAAVPGTKVHDLFFIPANLTHGWSTVNDVVSWLNIRWDVNWAAR